MENKKLTSNQIALSILSAGHTWNETTDLIEKHAMDFALWVSRKGFTEKTIESLYKEYEQSLKITDNQ